MTEFVFLGSHKGIILTQIISNYPNLFSGISDNSY